MQSHIIASTMLAAVGYDGAKRLLELKFRDGAIYTYFEVPAAVCDALLRAPSKGQYFNAHVRGQFACQRTKVWAG